MFYSSLVINSHQLRRGHTEVAEVNADALIMCPPKGPKLVLDLENFAKIQYIVIWRGSNRAH